MAKTRTCQEEERTWCSHCGVNTPTRREGKAGTVKACNWCGKILADETGTAEEYSQLFLRFLALQHSGNRFRRRRHRRRKLKL